MGHMDYFVTPSGDCNYGAILPLRYRLYNLYTKARMAAKFNLEDIFEMHPTPAGSISPLYFQKLYISDADKNPGWFSRVEGLSPVLHPMYERLELAKRFGLERLKALEQNWLGKLHSTGSFVVNSCAYRGNDVLVACQWYAFEIREAGENFHIVWADYGYADLKSSSSKLLACYADLDADGNIICDQREFRAEF